MDKVLKNILAFLESEGIPVVRFQKDIGLYHTAVSEWKSGKTKSYIKHLPKIAEYFGVSVDYLLGNIDPKEKLYTPEGEELAEHEQELIHYYRSLSDEGKKMILRSLGIDPESVDEL